MSTINFNLCCIIFTKFPDHFIAMKSWCWSCYMLSVIFFLHVDHVHGQCLLYKQVGERICSANHEKYIFHWILMKYFKFDSINFGLNMTHHISTGNILVWSSLFGGSEAILKKVWQKGFVIDDFVIICAKIMRRQEKSEFGSATEKWVCLFCCVFCREPFIGMHNLPRDN
jgi:hypothetical protein